MSKPEFILTTQRPSGPLSTMTVYPAQAAAYVATFLTQRQNVAFPDAQRVARARLGTLTDGVESGTLDDPPVSFSLRRIPEPPSPLDLPPGSPLLVLVSAVDKETGIAFHVGEVTGTIPTREIPEGYWIGGADPTIPEELRNNHPRRGLQPGDELTCWVTGSKGDALACTLDEVKAAALRSDPE